MTQTVERSQTPPTSTPLSPWLRLARFAALVVAAWAATLQILAGHVIPPVMAIGVGFIGLAAMLRRPGKRTGLIAAGVAAIALLGNAPEVVAQFSRPASALEFVLNVVVTSSVAVIVVSGVASFKGWTTERVSTTRFGWVGAVVLGTAIALVASARVESAQPVAGDIRVTARDVAFDQETIAAVPGRVAFWIDNQDPFHHNFTVRGTDQAIELPASSAQRGEFDLAEGTYQVFCDLPGHENMTIELVVEG